MAAIEAKRACDVVGSALGLLVLSPILAAVAIAIRLADGPGVLFRHHRAGRDGRAFTLLKFRTMAEAPRAVAGPVADAERITRLGLKLRRTSLDELPQLVNVLRGEMSLVGPRPLPVCYVARYTPRQARRLEVRPGITGLAQVAGRNAVGWAERLELDVLYVERRSWALDTGILLRTIGMVLSGRGVAAPGHATMPEFRGEDGSGHPAAW